MVPQIDTMATQPVGMILLPCLQLWLGLCVAAFLFCSYTDLRTRRIPNRVTYPLLAGTLLLAAAYPPWALSALGGGALAALIFLLPRWLFGAQQAGMGDVKLAALGGLLLGPAYTLTALTLAYGVALLVLTPLLLTKRLQWRQPVAFGPYLAIGFIGVLLTLWLPLARLV